MIIFQPLSIKVKMEMELEKSGRPALLEGEEEKDGEETSFSITTVKNPNVN